MLRVKKLNQYTKYYILVLYTKYYILVSIIYFILSLTSYKTYGSGFFTELRNNSSSFGGNIFKKYLGSVS